MLAFKNNCLKRIFANKNTAKQKTFDAFHSAVEFLPELVENKSIIFYTNQAFIKKSEGPATPYQ